MLNRLTQEFGTWLTLSATTAPLTNAYQRGTAVSLVGVDQFKAEIMAAFDAATDKISIEFEVQCSDDLTNWRPVQSTRVSDFNVAAEQSLAASAGNTVRDGLLVTMAAQAKYVAIAAKYTGGGAPKAGDSAVSKLTYDAN